MPPTLEWVRVVIEGGVLVGIVKALIHIGAVLQEVKSIKETVVDQGGRIKVIEQHLWNYGAHK